MEGQVLDVPVPRLSTLTQSFPPMNHHPSRIVCVLPLLAVLTMPAIRAEEWPIVYETDFEKGADRWSPTEKDTWKIKSTEGGHVYSQYTKAGTSNRLTEVPTTSHSSMISS